MDPVIITQDKTSIPYNKFVLYKEDYANSNVHHIKAKSIYYASTPIIVFETAYDKVRDKVLDSIHIFAFKVNAGYEYKQIDVETIKDDVIRPKECKR